jgi:hypothetical protein
VSNIRILWIDVLCFSSLIKVIFNSKEVDRVYFLNSTLSISPFIGIASFLIKRPISQIKNIVYSTENIQNKRLREIVQNRLNKVIQSCASGYSSNLLEIYPYTKKLNIHKFDKHIEELLYFYLYKIVEIKVLSEFINISGSNKFLLREGDFKDLNKTIIGSDNVLFFKWVSFNGGLVRKRKKYFYDEYVNNYYYASKFYFGIKFFAIWTFTCVYSIFSKTYNRKKSVGIELVQSRVRLDDVNDLYWLKYADISNENVVGISFIDYDSESISTLKKIGVDYFVPSDLVFKKMSFFSGNNIVGVKKDYFRKTFKHILEIFPLLFKGGIENWVEVQYKIYCLRVIYWQDIYQNLGVVLLWSMLDVDPEKNIKSQAIEGINGKFIGSHWSNYSEQKIDNQKSYDIFFAWSDYFSKYNAIDGDLFISGYPSDHYFKKIRSTVPRRYENNFVISFHDNIVSNDIMYSMQMQVDMHLMLISLLKEYHNVVILLKPKRMHTFEEVAKEVPDLKKWIESGRIEVFLGDSNFSKVSPAQVGMMSDLVVGLGISTAAAECCFSGITSFHVDLTGFYDNEFANKCDGKFLYRSISDLRLAIENQINGIGFSVEECQEYHKILDPFQDGMSYKRTGKKIKELLESLTNC